MSWIDVLTYMHGEHNRKGVSPQSGDGLSTQAKAWATPMASDGTNGGPNQKLGGKTGTSLSSQAAQHHGTMANSSPVATAPRGSLNPAFHLWLMGWPEGWTSCEPLETGKFQQWLHSHGASSLPR